MTHIDRLRPFDEWSPPYDLAAGTKPKENNIRTATEAIAADLGFSPDDAVPVSLLAGKTYNVENVWANIASALPEAMRAQLLRCLHDLKEDWSWSSVWSQTTNAGRAIAGSLRKRPKMTRCALSCLSAQQRRRSATWP